MSAFKIVYYFSMVSILPPAIAGAFFLKTLPNPLKILVIFIFTTLSLEAASYILYLRGQNNMFLFHAHSFIELAFLSVMYWLLLNSRLWNWVIRALLLAFVVFSALNMAFYEGSQEFNANQRYAEGIIVLVFVFGYLNKLISNKEYGYIENHPYFILTIALLLYFFGTLFLFLFGKLLLSDSNGYWAIHGFLNITLNLMNTFVLWKAYKIAGSLS